MCRKFVKWLGISVALIVAGILGAALVGLYAEYRRDHWVPPGRWVGLVLYTAFGFGVIVTNFREHWREVRFWLYFNGLLLVHLLCYAMLLLSVQEWRLIWFLPLSLAEFPVVGYVLDVVMGRYDSVRRRT
jgi:hypothetical protein